MGPLGGPAVLALVRAPSFVGTEFRTSCAHVSRPAPLTMESNLPSQLGIWRLGESLHENSEFCVRLAQPVDATGSPRWDYAIKIGRSPEGREGITRSIELASTTAHPNLVPVLDSDANHESAYLVMPRLDGKTMRWQLTAGPRFPLPVALWLVRQICQGLSALHANGWTHGDVKPENVIVGNNGHATLIDFGFAHRGILPQSTPFRGTPDYAAPELLTNASSSSAASDVYATGKILWQWLTRVETSNDSVLSPICGLVEQMADDVPQQRPAAEHVVRSLLKLEIDTLGDHIVPDAISRAA